MSASDSEFSATQWRRERTKGRQKKPKMRIPFQRFYCLNICMRCLEMLISMHAMLLNQRALMVIGDVDDDECGIKHCTRCHFKSTIHKSNSYPNNVLKFYEWHKYLYSVLCSTSHVPARPLFIHFSQAASHTVCILGAFSRLKRFENKTKSRKKIGEKNVYLYYYKSSSFATPPSIFIRILFHSAAI